MTRTRTALASFTLIVLGMAAPDAHAQRAVLSATGTLQAVSDPGGTLDPTAAVGTPFTLTYVFDYVPADARDSSNNFSIYYFTASGTGATVTFGDYAFTPGGYLSDASVGGAQNTPPKDGVTFQTGGETVASPGMTITSGAGVSLQLVEAEGRILPNNALPPPSAYTLSDFRPYSQDASGSYFLADLDLNQNSSPASVKGSITTLTVNLIPAAAPEPSQAAALATGLLGLGVLAIKAKRRTA